MAAPNVGVHINSRVFKPAVLKTFLKRIEEDLREQLSMTFRLLNLPAPNNLASLRVVPSTEMKQGLLVTYQTDTKPTGPCMIIQDVLLPFCYADPVPPMLPIEHSEVDTEVLKYFLRFLFRKQDFLEGQLETIQRILNGKDTIVLLPTGAGKSIAFQLAAFLLPGAAIAVDPIISLIHDQIDNLRRVGIDRVGSVTSDLRIQEDKRDAVARFGQGEYLLFYISPERFQMVDFRNALRETSMSRPIPLVAIDEAHCVSEWGHEFRTAYLNLGRIIREYCWNGLKVSVK
jgi:superfamily II DNA helicase RecQ